MVASRPPLQLLFEFSTDDRLEECAMTLQEEGEKALLQDDKKGLDLLEKAAQLDPSSTALLYRQGVALFEYGSYHNCVATLRKSAVKFSQAISLNPNWVQAWQAWANSLFLIASLTKQPEELTKARDKIEKAVGLNIDKELTAEIHWDAALIYQKLAEASGELDDLYSAISHFEKGSSCSQKVPHEFWNAFGKAYSTLSEKLEDIRPVVQSITCYKQSIALSLANLEGWVGLGKGLKKLYLSSYENEYYLQACDCFAAATQLAPQRHDLWLERIEFIIDSSRREKEITKLHIALEKCEHVSALLASPLEEETPSIAYLHLQAYWAEGLALLGAWTNRIDLIQEAERKMDQLLEKAPEEDIFVINQYGKCLFSFAHYYRDLDLYYRAIEEFQASISIDRTQLTPWAWMGTAFAKVYDCTDDIEALENALYFYSKALQIKNTPHFYCEIATLLLQLGEVNQTSEPIDEALSYLEHLLQTYKSIAFDHPAWFFQYGLALNIQGHLKDDPALHHKSLEAFVNVLMLSPSFPKIHHRIGVVYCHLGTSLDEPDYFYRSLQHFKLASRSQVEDEALLMDWAATWTHLAQYATDSLVRENSFREAERKLIEAARLGSQLVYYQLASLYSEQGSVSLAMVYLHKAHAAKNLPPIDEMMDDDWLESVRATPQFQEFLALLSKN
jgi:tetratricopeptide (TPR) repeat protein